MTRRPFNARRQRAVVRCVGRLSADMVSALTGSNDFPARGINSHPCLRIPLPIAEIVAVKRIHSAYSFNCARPCLLPDQGDGGLWNYVARHATNRVRLEQAELLLRFDH